MPRFSTRFVSQSASEGIAGMPAGGTHHDMGQRNTVVLEKTPHARERRLRLRSRGVLQENADIAGVQPANEIAAAQMFTQTGHAGLRCIWTNERIFESDNNCGDRDAALYSITGRTFKNIVEAAMSDAAITRPG